MNKKLMAILLTAAMTAMSVLPVLADASATLDARLAKVTKLVKEQLKLQDDYESFVGNLTEEGANVYWQLEWQSDKSHLSIAAGEDGKIYSYNQSNSDNNYDRYDSYYKPRFPKTNEAAAKAAAEKFIQPLLSKGESLKFNADQSKSDYNGDGYYYLKGIILLNQLPSPITFHVQIDQNLEVRSYYRSDLSIRIAGGVPDAVAGSAKDAAAKLLKDKVVLQLQYVRDPKASDKASLQYVAQDNDKFVVDAKTGELIDVNQLYQKANMDDEFSMDKGVDSGGAMNASRGGNSLSSVELSGIDKIKGVLDKSALDKKVRAITELGITNTFELSNLYYNLDQKTEEVFANMVYAQKNSDGEITRKTVYLNAKTGELISCYTSYPYREDYAKTAKLDQKAAEVKAAAFLQKYAKAHFDAAKQGKNPNTYRDDKSNPSIDLSYERQVNGYPFPENQISISINRKTGEVDSFQQIWDDKVKLDAPTGLISMSQAVAAYAKEKAPVLCYVALPTKIDLSQPWMEVYAKSGVKYVYQLKLCYQANRENQTVAIDAKTGKPVSYTRTEGDTKLNYNDIANSGAKKEIETLAQYGYGYAGGSFYPSAALTQEDLLKLLIPNANVQTMDPRTAEEIQEDLYRRAYSLGILKPEDKDPSKKITREALVKTLIEMSGYGTAAELKGIFTCSFRDAASISEECYGYVAIAQGLGIAQADKDGNFYPKKTATREDAARMFYQFLNR